MAVWRIRMRNGAEQDVTAQAWAMNQVGVWYGGWTADDFQEARNRQEAQIPPKPHIFLSECPNHNQFFDWNVPSAYYNTTRRFADIGNDDWVLVVTGQNLCLAHVNTPLQSDPNHPLNYGHEQFKFRGIAEQEQKTFPLAELPEVFSLFPQTGRSNVFQYGELASLANFLVEAENAQEVTEGVNALPLPEFIEALGPGGWESLAEAYLIMEEQYVPVGLRVGKTLKTFDLLGRRLQNGARLLVQCKNNRRQVRIEPDFMEAVQEANGAGIHFSAYYFAYAGCTDEPPDGVQVVTGEHIVDWLENDPNGQAYLGVLR